jgi:hypothetical protein
LAGAVGGGMATTCGQQRLVDYGGGFGLESSLAGVSSLKALWCGDAYIMVWHMLMF